MSDPSGYILRVLCIPAMIGLCPVRAAESPSPPVSHDASQTADEDRAASSAPITISKDTTRFTGPLTDDGFVDFAAALDRQRAEGATVENNAAVPFFQAMGPHAIDERIRSEFYERLGIPAPGEDGDRFVPWSDRIDDAWNDLSS